MTKTQSPDAFNWYKMVPEYGSWGELFAPGTQSLAVPDEWIVYLSDVTGSTKAIEAGRYKDVNTAGCLPVMALGNLFDSFDFPFVFGGDGITVVLPPQFDADVVATLRDTRTMAKSVFGLDLRLARVPMKHLLSQGASLSVAACRISQFYRQSVFFGDAIEKAEDLLKAKGPDAAPWAIGDEGAGPETADYSGFNCRWQDIPSPQGLTVSLVIKAGLKTRSDTEPGGSAIGGPVDANAWVSRLIERFNAIIGSEEEVHPIGIEQQKLTSAKKAAKVEVAVTTWNKHGIGLLLSRFFQGLFVRIVMLAANAGLKWGLPIRQGHIQANTRREDNRASSDVRKFDGSLKLIAATSAERAENLRRYLDAEEQAGRIIYGMHTTDRALMTCMVHLASQGEVHFVDGADGGYTMAAKMLKDKLRSSRAT